MSILHKRALNQAIIHAGRIPTEALMTPGILVRALRSALLMSQAHLAKRCGIPQAHIALVEAGKTNVQWATIVRLCDAMFCDLLILPRPRKRPGDALAERYLERPNRVKIWD